MIDFSAIKAIFFDADDTLFEVRGSIGEHYASHLSNHGHNITAAEIDSVIFQAWQRMSSSYDNREEGYVTDHARDDHVWQEFLSNVMHDVGVRTPSDELLADIYGAFAKASSRQLLPYAEQLLEALSPHVALGILTNNDRRIHQLIPELGLAKYFQHIFCASDIGYKKPSHKVFMGITEQLGITTREILYIGDCPKNDVAGAVNADWNAIWLNRGLNPFSESKAEDYPETQAVPTIHCFSELLEKLYQLKEPTE
ncbi:HAD family hydrolase [bacterium]|nr:HAD family hydrolase [bacterium]